MGVDRHAKEAQELSAALQLVAEKRRTMESDAPTADGPGAVAAGSLRPAVPPAGDGGSTVGEMGVWGESPREGLVGVELSLAPGRRQEAGVRSGKLLEGRGVRVLAPERSRTGDVSNISQAGDSMPPAASSIGVPSMALSGQVAAALDAAAGLQGTGSGAVLASAPFTDNPQLQRATSRGRRDPPPPLAFPTGVVQGPGAGAAAGVDGVQQEAPPKKDPKLGSPVRHSHHLSYPGMGANGRAQRARRALPPGEDMTAVAAGAAAANGGAKDEGGGEGSPESPPDALRKGKDGFRAVVSLQDLCALGEPEWLHQPTPDRSQADISAWLETVPSTAVPVTYGVTSSASPRPVADDITMGMTPAPSTAVQGVAATAAGGAESARAQAAVRNAKHHKPQTPPSTPLALRAAGTAITQVDSAVAGGTRAPGSAGGPAASMAAAAGYNPLDSEQQAAAGSQDTRRLQGSSTPAPAAAASSEAAAAAAPSAGSAGDTLVLQERSFAFAPLVLGRSVNAKLQEPQSATLPRLWNQEAATAGAATVPAAAAVAAAAATGLPVAAAAAARALDGGVASRVSTRVVPSATPPAAPQRPAAAALAASPAPGVAGSPLYSAAPVASAVSLQTAPQTSRPFVVDPFALPSVQLTQLSTSRASSPALLAASLAQAGHQVQLPPPQQRQQLRPAATGSSDASLPTALQLHKQQQQLPLAPAGSSEASLPPSVLQQHQPLQPEPSGGSDASPPLLAPSPLQQQPSSRVSGARRSKGWRQLQRQVRWVVASDAIAAGWCPLAPLHPHLPTTGNP